MNSTRTQQQYKTTQAGKTIATCDLFLVNTFLVNGLQRSCSAPNRVCGQQNCTVNEMPIVLFFSSVASLLTRIFERWRIYGLQVAEVKTGQRRDTLYRGFCGFPPKNLKVLDWGPQVSCVLAECNFLWKKVFTWQCYNEIAVFSITKYTSYSNNIWSYFVGQITKYITIK